MDNQEYKFESPISGAYSWRSE